MLNGNQEIIEKRKGMNNNTSLVQIIKRNRENYIVIFFMTVMSFFFLLKSPLHPWIGGDTGTDDSVFKTVALMMEKGYMPYRDSFDHKGPFLYILNWIGNKISSYSGIWVIEFLFMIGMTFMLYKISRLKCRINSSILVTMFSVTALFPFFKQGNLTEEYAMLFIAIALYIFLDYLLNQKVTKFRLLICGFSFGAVFLLRANMVPVWMVFCLFIFARTVIEKKWDVLAQFILWFVGGICIIAVPILLWLAVNHSLSAFWESYIVFNKVYVSVESKAVSGGRWNCFLSFFNTKAFIISFCAIAYMCIIKDRVLNIVYMIYMLATLLLLCISGLPYNHYGMILIPAYSYPLASIFGKIEEMDSSRIARIVAVIIKAFLLVNIILPGWLPIITSLPEVYESREEEHKSGLAVTVSSIVIDNTDADDTISVYGNWDLLYILSDRRHATRYSYQFPVGKVMPEIMEEYMKALEEEQPQFIVIQEGRYDDNISGFLNDNNYHLTWSQYEDSTDGVLVYMK